MGNPAPATRFLKQCQTFPEDRRGSQAVALDQHNIAKMEEGEGAACLVAAHVEKFNRFLIQLCSTSMIALQLGYMTHIGEYPAIASWYVEFTKQRQALFE